MRLNLNLSPSTDALPFNHVHWLIGTLHKWVGPDNLLHDGPSLYSFGWLKGARVQNGALHFPDGARWRLTFYDAEAAKDALRGILDDPSVCAGMHVLEAQQQMTPSFSGTHRFKVDSPVVVRTRRDDGSRAYLTYDDAAADAAMTQTLRSKMKIAGLDASHHDATVAFDRSYSGARTKLTTIEKSGPAIKHKGSLCPVIVDGTPEAVQFAWTVGIGELTGSGFGAVQ